MKNKSIYFGILKKLGMMICLVFSMITSVYSLNENWWDINYEYRKQITLTNPSSSTISDFVAYLNISKETAMLANYNDLRFTSGTCTGSSNSEFYEYEIEYSDVNRAVVWIKIPNYVAGANNICMYYGNPSAVSNQSSNVWSNYGLVYHMESAGNDFSPNNRDKVADVGSPIQGTDWLGYKITYDGNDAWDQRNLAYWEVGWDTRTHELVFETSNDVTSRQAIFAEGGGTNGVMLYILSGQLYARWWSESQGWSGGHINTAITTNTKYYVSMSFDFPGEYNLYVNGVKINGLATPATMNAHSGDGGIAYTRSSKDFHDGSFTGQYFDGTIHELNIYDTPNSDEFVSAKHENVLNHNSNTNYQTQEQWLPIISSSITSPDPLQVYFIEQDNITTVQAQIDCTGPASRTCSTVSNKLQYNTGGSSFSDVSTSSTTPAWTSSTLSQDCNLNGGDNCIVSWVLNVTDVPLSTNKFRVISTSSNPTYDTIYSENLTIKVLGQYAMSFNYTTYTFPQIIKNGGDITLDALVRADKGSNNNVQVTCISGDCSIITDDFTDGNPLNEPATSPITFTCSDDNYGSYSATYQVTSTEYPSGTNIVLSCEVIPIYGPINSVLNSPSTTNETTVGKDLVFKINSSVQCAGLCGEIKSYLVHGSNFGDLSDGDLTVSVADTIVNDYTYLVDDELNTDNDILVNDATNFGVGDEILVWQVQNGSESGVAGNYEFIKIISKAGNTLTLENNLTNNYYSGNFDMVGASVTQVVRIPNYNHVVINGGASITAPAWDGFSGGIVVFRANTLTQTGSIDVSQKGFRGGDCNGCGNAAWGDQGEGYLGTGIGSLSANGNGGGGGYGPSGFNGEPGAGGGLGTAGENGVSSFTSIGGSSIGDVNIDKLFFGGGAGAGGDDDNPAINSEFVDGAGAVIIFAKNATDVNILANGENGIASGGAAGSTGGGAGGTIKITSEVLTINQISAVGGLGGIDADDTGGNGGDGRIRLDYVVSSGNTPNPTPGKIGDITDIFELVSTSPISTPFYTLNTQPQTCIPNEDETCEFIWNVNATGEMNDTKNFSIVSFSNISSINASQSQIAQIKIFNSLPEIFILNPTNNSKLLGEGKIQFMFNVTDLDDGLLNCNIFLNGINFQNMTCNDGLTKSFNQTIPFGLNNWSIYVKDSKEGIADTGNIFFKYFQSNKVSVSKSIARSGVNIYDVNIDVNNLVNVTNDIVVDDFVSSGFNSGSYNILFDFTNLTSGFYTGNLNVWDSSVGALSSFNINYGLTNIQNKKVQDNFVIGLE